MLFLGDMMRVIFTKRLHSHEKTLETSCRDPCQTREVITLPMTICTSMAFKVWECCLPFSSRRWAGCQDIRGRTGRNVGLDKYQGLIGCTPSSVPMVFVVFSRARDSW